MQDEARGRSDTERGIRSAPSGAALEGGMETRRMMLDILWMLRKLTGIEGMDEGVASRVMPLLDMGILCDTVMRYCLNRATMRMKLPAAPRGERSMSLSDGEWVWISWEEEGWHRMDLSCVTARQGSDPSVLPPVIRLGFARGEGDPGLLPRILARVEVDPRTHEELLALSRSLRTVLSKGLWISCGEWGPLEEAGNEREQKRS